MGWLGFLCFIFMIEFLCCAIEIDTNVVDCNHEYNTANDGFAHIGKKAIHTHHFWHSSN